MLKTARYLLISSILLAMASTAFANDFMFVGAIDSHKGAFGNVPAGVNDSTSSGTGFGGGVLIGFHLSSEVTFEPGFLYLSQKLTDTGTNTEVKTNEFQVPVVLRYWFHHMFSLGVGGYYTFANGDVTETTNGSVKTADYAGTVKKNDYGLVGSVSFRIPMTSEVKFVADGRYLYGLKDLNDGIYTGGVTLKNREIQGLIGFAFEFGGHGGHGGNY